MATIMCDHPAWTTTTHGVTRVMRSGASTWLIASDSLLSDVGMTVVDGPGGGPAPEFLHVDQPTLVESSLGPALAPLVPLLRVRNSCLWDAIGNAILGKIVTADQARVMYRRFCTAFGRPVEALYGYEYLFPDPECVSRMPVTEFGELKMSFTRVPLRAAATAYLEHGTAWSQLDPVAMVTALRSVPGIGPWIAGAAVADFSGDFSVYPYPDRQLRTCLRRAAPGADWPVSVAQFRTRWHAMAGDNVSGVSGLTQLVLAWGETHSRSARSDRTDQPFMDDLPEPVDLLDVLQTYQRHRVRA